MTASVLRDAFAHHVWATLTLLDACAALTPDQLQTSVPGTFGPIIGTLRHLVSADTSYLELLSGGRVAVLDEEAGATIAELRAAMEADGPAWQAVLDGAPDPDQTVVRRRDDGSQSHAPMGVRLAQAIHHGTDHRSQVCTALTSLGIEPPAIDVWDHAAVDGRLTEVPAP